MNGIVFLHGGISDEVASLGCEAINDTVAKDMKGLPGDPAQIPTLFSSRETGPLWYRGLAQEPEAAFAPTLESILKRMGARAIVVGHTPAVGRITPRFGGRVVQIDSGMLDGTFFPGGAPSALVIEGGTMTAVYLDRRDRSGERPYIVNSTTASPRRATRSSKCLTMRSRRNSTAFISSFVITSPIAWFIASNVSPRSACEQRAIAARQLIRLHQFLAQAERARVVDQPERPVLGPEQVALVAVAVLNQLVEDETIGDLLRSSAPGRAHDGCSCFSRPCSSNCTSSIHQVTAASLPSTARFTDIGTLFMPSRRASR